MTSSPQLRERHCLYIGWVLGMALVRGLPVKPVVDDENNYTDRIRLALPNGRNIDLIVPEPPDDWPEP